MLPTDRPIVPLVLYEEYNFPLSVHVNAPNICSHLVQKTAAKLANEATHRASNNPARMYTFNLLVMNNWNNPEFQELLNFVMWYIYLEVKKGNYRSPEMAIDDCVNRYMTLYASTMALTVDAVRSVASPQLIDASSQNAEVFHNLKLEIQHMQNQMYQNNGAYPQQQMHPQQMQQPMMQPGMQPGYFPQQQSMFQPQMYPAQMPPQQHYPQQMPVQQPMMHQGGNGHFMQQNQNGRQTLDNMAGNPSRHDIANDRFGGKQIQQKQYFAEEPVYVRPEQPTPPPALPPEVVKGIQDLVYKKGNEMDRSKHTITFMGKKYAMNTVVRSDNFVEQTEVISKASALNEEDQTSVDGDRTILDLNESALVLRGQSRHLEVDSSKIYRCFGIATNAVISKETAMADYIDTLKDSRDLPELVGRMCSLGEAFKRASQEWNAEGSQDSKIVVFSAIDLHLTKLVNRFVKNNLQLEKVAIDSFVEDYMDLEAYVISTSGPMGSLALKNFGQEVLQMTFGTDGDELASEAKNLLDLSEELECVFLPENYSLTYLPLTDKELDYDFGNKLWSVNHGRTPLLAKILDSLTIHKKQSQRTCLNDLLITQDGVIYRVYENVLNKGYLIRRDN